jgi:hypothetical protein
MGYLHKANWAFSIRSSTSKEALLGRRFCGFGDVIERRKNRFTNGGATDTVNVVVPSSKRHSIAVLGVDNSIEPSFSMPVNKTNAVGKAWWQGQHSLLIFDLMQA